jgi:CRP/FNR family transcriptional regulator, cyclic AMP receptor protein
MDSAGHSAAGPTPMTTIEFDVEAIAAGERRVLPFASGGVIYQAGDDGDCAYIIKRGRVELRQKGRPVDVLRAGEIFGEMGMINGGPRMSTAVAAEFCELVPIDARLFASLIRDDNEFALTVMRLMARRHRATIEMFERCLDKPVAVASAGGGGRKA